MSTTGIDDILYKEYLNLDHGIELFPNINFNHRGNENGILFFCEYLILKQISGQSLTSRDKETFISIIRGIEVVSGLYDRGASDKIRENPKRSQSHDNLSAIASISKMLGTSHASEIASYGLKNFGIYNNNQKGFSLPMNPANYSIWLALANKSAFLQILFLPFFLINFIISMSKKKENTSSKLLYLVELFPLKEIQPYGLLYSLYLARLKNQYGEKYLKEIFGIYFKDENHPNNVLARSL